MDRSAICSLASKWISPLACAATQLSIPDSQMMMYTRLQVSDELLRQISKGQLCPLDHRQSHLGPISRLQDKGQPYFPRDSKHSPKTKSHSQIPNPPLSKTFTNHTTASSHIKSLGMDHSHPTDDSSTRTNPTTAESQISNHCNPTIPSSRPGSKFLKNPTPSKTILRIAPKQN